MTEQDVADMAEALWLALIDWPHIVVSHERYMDRHHGWKILGRIIDPQAFARSVLVNLEALRLRRERQG